MDKQDYGKKPYVINIEEETKANDKFRIAKWTGQYLQMTLMSIEPGGEVGLEVHEDHDQFIRIEEGEAEVLMGATAEDLDFKEKAASDFAIFIPAGVWHNIVNSSESPLKLYSIYAPPEHPNGTIHETFEESEAAEAAQNI